MNALKEKALEEQLKAIKETTRKATLSKKTALDYLQRAGLIEKATKRNGNSYHAESSTNQHSGLS